MEFSQYLYIYYSLDKQAYLNYNPMEPISSEQYEKVLQFMQLSNCEDFAQASEILSSHHFNIQAAINSRMRNQSRQEQNVQQQDEDKSVRKYVQFLYYKHENSNIIKSIFWFLANTIRGILIWIVKITLPQFLKRLTINSNFQNLYRRQLKLQLNDQNIKRTLKTAANTFQKPALIIISSKKLHSCIIQTLNQPNIVYAINKHFIVSGIIEGEDQHNLIPGLPPSPAIIVLRQNIYEEIQTVQSFLGNEKITQIDINKIMECVKKDKNLQRRDRNIGIRYRNYVRKQYYGYNSAFYEEDQERVPVLSEVSSSMIKEQNQTYQTIEQEAIKKKKIQEELRLKQIEQAKILEQKQQERQARKMSIPDQPLEGEIIKLTFRCPDGSVKVRGFLPTDQIQMVYSWVETNDEIQFQDNKQRKFQLLASYPPTPLCDNKHKILSQVFDSHHQKVMIRQL